jgi:hypothetical protein
MPHPDYTLENLNRREKALAKKVMKEVLSDILEEGGAGPCRGNHEKNPGIVDDMKVRALQRNCPSCWVD